MRCVCGVGCGLFGVGARLWRRASVGRHVPLWTNSFCEPHGLRWDCRQRARPTRPDRFCAPPLPRENKALREHATTSCAASTPTLDAATANRAARAEQRSGDGYCNVARQPPGRSLRPHVAMPCMCAGKGRRARSRLGANHLRAGATRRNSRTQGKGHQQQRAPGAAVCPRPRRCAWCPG